MHARRRIVFVSSWLWFALLVGKVPETSAQDSPGRFTGPGYALTASFVPDTSEILLGQPLFVTFTIKNEHSAPFKFLTGGASRGSIRDNNYQITARNSSGVEVEDPYGYSNYGGLGTFWTLAPGQTYSMRLFLPYWCRFKEAGDYIVTGATTFIDLEEKKHEPVTVQLSFNLRIMRDAARLSAIVDELGRLIATDDYQKLAEASMALAEIDSESVVPHLVAALTRGVFGNKLNAIRGLGRRSSPEAIAALTEALKDEDPTVRTAAMAELMLKNSHGEALRELLQQFSRAGGDERIRLIRALGATRSEAALQQLLTILDDPDARIRTATVQAVSEFPFKERIVGPLRGRLDDPDLNTRLQVIDSLTRLGEPLEIEKLSAILRETKVDVPFDPSQRPSTMLISAPPPVFTNTLRMATLRQTEDTARALIGALDFGDPSLRNRKHFLIISSLQGIREAPKLTRPWHHDLSRNGESSELEENARTLAELKAWLEARPK